MNAWLFKQTRCNSYFGERAWLPENGEISENREIEWDGEMGRWGREEEGGGGEVGKWGDARGVHLVVWMEQRVFAAEE